MRSLAACELLAGSFLRHPGLVLPGVARLLGRVHCAHLSRPMAAVAPAHCDCCPNSGISESDRLVRVRAVAHLLSLMRNMNHGFRYEVIKQATGPLGAPPPPRTFRAAR